MEEQELNEKMVREAISELAKIIACAMLEQFEVNGVKYIMKPGHSRRELGIIPDFLREDDPRPAAAQYNERYGYGGGWMPIKKYVLGDKGADLHYPGEAPMEPICFAFLHEEAVFFYPGGYVCVIQPKGDSDSVKRQFEVSRLD